MREAANIPLYYSEYHCEEESEEKPREEIAELTESSRLKRDAISSTHSNFELREEERRSFIKRGITGARH